MRKLATILLGLLACASTAFGQRSASKPLSITVTGGASTTPAVAFYSACPNSSSLNAGSWGGTPPFDYNCFVDSNAMVAGNTLIVSIAFDNTGGGQMWSVVDDKGDTFTQIASSATTNNKQMLVFEATNIAGGEARIDMRLTGTVNGFWQPTVLEVYNAATVDATSCNTGSSSSITAGSLTPSVTGDLIYQVLYNPGLSQGTPAQSSTYTAGAQSNINWNLWFQLLEDGAAGQWGVYSATSAINPTFSAASSQSFISCAVALKQGSVGSANVLAQRVNGVEFDAKPTLGSNIPWKMGANITGHTVYVTTMTNAIVNPTTCCAISSVPALTWTQSGADAGGTNGHNHSDVYCATSTNPIGPLALTLNFSAPGTNDGIFVIYDVDGWGCNLDADSGVQAGNDTTDLIPPLCVSCLTPTTQNDFIVGNEGQAFNTVVGFNTQTNATFNNDSCYNTFTNINGSSQTCENNGFFHGTNGSNLAAITLKLQDASGAQGGSPPQTWAGRLAAYKPVPPSWSNLIASSRAMDWSKAGLLTLQPCPGCTGGVETTVNPWTPPTRSTQCGATLTPRGGGLDDTAAIQTAISGCNPGTFVSMNGAFTITSAAQFYGTHIGNKNNVTLRGTGPMTTSITLNAAGSPIQFGAFADGGGGNITNLATNPKGQTSFIVANVTGTGSLVANNVAYINQADNGYTCSVPIPQGATCSGSSVDTGGVFFCQHDPLCNDASHTGGGQHHSEEQALRIISATNNGDGTWTVVTDPGLYMNDWSAARGATLRWNNSAFTVFGMGIEDMTIRVPDNGGSGDNLQIQSCVGCWVKGLRIIGPNNTAVLLNHNCVHCLVMNNYMFGESNTFVGSALENLYASGEDGDTLILNNIGDGGMFNDDDFDMHQGIVMAYNYARDVDTNHYQSTQFEHEAGSALMLREANQFGRINDDATWSSHNFNTNFRNNLDCGDFPYQIAGGSGGGIQVSSFARFSNLVGNVIGVGVPASYLTTGTSKCTTYEVQADDGGAFNVNGHTPFDANFGTTGSVALTKASLLRWGNVTTNGSTNTTGFTAAENPSNLSNWPNAVPYVNLASPSTNLPCSFFLQNYLPSAIAASPTTCTPTTTGHTGLSWWKTCNSWTSFPTSCASFTIPAFPAAGPDVSGFTNDLPAAVAWKHLPIDSTFQNSFTITASSFSGGTETLTVTGLPALFNFLGGFQLSGVPNACFPGATPAELLMTGSSSTTVQYALASDPGANACVGTFLWPDIRQFDERTYVADP